MPRSVYLLRLNWRTGYWQITLQNVQGGEPLSFESFDQLFEYLRGLFVQAETEKGGLH
ncbi:hypothetical protein [Deinococcus altitudinis]|uniref:hypothetical protein n=1 Tax=Deinococcus altitudinis TaxID=468914 RepID=UPI0038920C31